VISFKIPPVVKGPKNTRFKKTVEKKKKKKDDVQKKGSEPAHYVTLMSTIYF
jgi:hypothetical protein